jgi:cell division protein FtsI/penicillin-binding protein 2
LALAGADSEGKEDNSALEGNFPAASLFKIITAAAAMEKASLTADDKVAYDGSKHTLFKSNVAKETNEGLHEATIKESFAESINTVFGKLGIYTIGSSDLSDYAVRFLFNRPIEFEKPVESSQFVVEQSDDSFHLAELASGFNRLTKVSPLHGAMLASLVANGGKLFEPTFVKEVFDRDNNILYQSRPNFLGQVISPSTSEELSDLMQAAVSEGTGRKQFSDVLTHPVLSKLVIGGKSGTINNDDGLRVDWFVAFVRPMEEKDREIEPLALSAVVVHNGRTNVISQELVRRAILAYYKPKLSVD